MKVNKKERQAIILDYINKYEISTQDELVNMLKANKLNITQATVSRDIKELNIVKANIDNGKQKFVILNDKTDPGNEKLFKIFAEATLSINVAGNINVVKTLPGMAPACASAIDAMNNSKIVGTIAGDDTIFVAVEHIDQANLVKNELIKFTQDGV